ncbi:type 1 fimbrial protein, partial [Klebsiella pneumoniae]
MKYRFAGALLVGLLSMSVSTSQGADINITVNGRVVARPCNIATTNASIDLGDLFT